MKATGIRLAVFISLAALAGSCGKGPEQPKHVLVILIDTLRADRLSCYGYDRQTSPHIDNLAANGVRFANATAQSSWTAPSMVSMFTGTHLSGERFAVPDDMSSMPEFFAAEGYRTGAFVVNPLIHNEENGFRRGFERFEPHGQFQDIAGWITASGGRKTFTYVHWVDPHDPYGPAPEYQHFMQLPGRIPDAEREYYDSLASDPRFGDLDSNFETIGAAHNGYDDDIRLVDSKVDILLRALEEAGVREQAVIVIASDHGEGLWKHANYEMEQEPAERNSLLTTHKMTHGNQLYEELLHVPLIISGPGVQAGRVVQQSVENADILPTLLDFLGVDKPRGITGQSLLPLLRGAPEQARNSFSLTRLVHSVQTADGLKLILPTEESRQKGLQPELYDLTRDPNERNNLADERPQDVQRLSQLIDQKLKQALPPAAGDDPLSDRNLEAMQALGYVK